VVARADPAGVILSHRLLSFECRGLPFAAHHRKLVVRMGAEVTSAHGRSPSNARERSHARDEKERDAIANATRAKGRRVFKSLFGPVPRVLAGVALAVSAVMPPDGIGFSLCLFERYTGLPCPGCGLTRSVACITHMKPAAAWGYHPFGFVVYALLVAAFVSNLFGAPRRERMLRWFETHGDGVNLACWAVTLALLAFGLARIAATWRGSFAA
jgi:hypothetical protein